MSFTAVKTLVVDAAKRHDISEQVIHEQAIEQFNRIKDIFFAPEIASHLQAVDCVDNMLIVACLSQRAVEAAHGSARTVLKILNQDLGYLHPIWRLKTIT